MRKAYAIAVPTPSPNTARSFGSVRKPVGLTHRVAAVAREIWTIKTAVNLAAITGYSARCCENWLYGDAAIPGDALAALMRSDFGSKFLAAVMDDATPAWWQSVVSILGVVSTRRRRLELELELRAAVDADKLALEAIQRAEASIRLPNANPNSPRALMRREIVRRKARPLDRKWGAVQ